MSIESLTARNAYLEAENKKLIALLKKMNKAAGIAISRHESPNQPDLIKAEVEDVTKVVDQIWSKTPKFGRSRSSREKLAKAWRKIPKAKRPNPLEVVKALSGWTLSEDWIKDDGRKVMAIDRWVNEKRWVDIPEPAKALNESSNAPRPL